MGTMRFVRERPTWRRRLALILPLFVVLGCGPGKGTVSGRVLYKGKPVPGGRVTFQPANSKFNSVHADLDEQGHYEATLPAGEVQATVDNRELEPSIDRAGGGPDLPPQVRKALAKTRSEAAPAESRAAARKPREGNNRYVPIPEKYYTLEKSGLHFRVESGSQTHDIELNDEP